MRQYSKPIESLAIADLETDHVWTYCETDNGDETEVKPVKHVPVKSLKGKVVGTQVRLSNGTLVWALIGNVDVGNPRHTEHFLTLSVEKGGQWFTLSRYHDFDYAENGPDSLSWFLGLHVQDVFPISYDIRSYVEGDPAGLSGIIPKEPREKLTRSEIIAMAVP